MKIALVSTFGWNARCLSSIFAFSLSCLYNFQQCRYTIFCNWIYYIVLVLIEYEYVICSHLSLYTDIVWLWLPWWRHQMETFSALLAISAGNSPVPGEFPTQRPVTRSFDVFFDLRLNKRLSKQSWDWWFETLSCPLWRHCNDIWESNS